MLEWFFLGPLGAGLGLVAIAFVLAALWQIGKWLLGKD